MRGVTEQGDAAARPVRQRIAVAAGILPEFRRGANETGEIDLRDREAGDVWHQFVAATETRPVLAARRRRRAVADFHQHRPVGEACCRARAFRDRINHGLGVQPARNDHRAPGEEHRPVARAAPQHQPVPARRALFREQRLAHLGMDAVGADQNVAARGVHMRAVAVEEKGADAAFVLRERTEAAAGVDRIRAQALDHRLVNRALQASAMDGELRHLVAGIEAALFVPDLLAVAGQVKQLEGADGGGIKPVEQTKSGQLADGMRQRVDADAELADRVGLFVQLAIDAARAQHQSRGEAADPAADDNGFHRPLLHTKIRPIFRVPRSLTPPQAAWSPPPSARPGSWAWP